MKKDNNKDKPATDNLADKETETSISTGKKAIEMQKKTSPAKPGKQEDEEKDDAEKWRNEG